MEDDERGKIHCTYWTDGKNKQNLNMMGRDIPWETQAQMES